MAQGDRQICILCIAALGGERPDLPLTERR